MPLLVRDVELLPSRRSKGLVHEDRTSGLCRGSACQSRWPKPRPGCTDVRQTSGRQCRLLEYQRTRDAGRARRQPKSEADVLKASRRRFTAWCGFVFGGCATAVQF